MPYFNFDLVIGEDFKSQGGMILETQESQSIRLVTSRASFASFVLSCGWFRRDFRLRSTSSRTCAAR